MRTMNYRLIAFIMVATLLGAGCSDEDVLTTSGSTTTNVGVVSQKNFNVVASDLTPAVYDPVANTFTQSEVTITATIGDRKNQALSDAHTVFFVTEWGVIEPSCVTKAGTCSVKWQTSSFTFFPANDTGGFAAGSPGNSIIGYTAGEEGFTDLNDNNSYDDPDGTFADFPEPFISINNTGVYTLGVDPIIDTVNGNDTTGANGVHDIADGFFNGPGCTHTTNCSTVARSAIVWDGVVLKLDGTTAGTFSLGGTMSGLTGTVVLQNNGTNNLSVSANGSFTFSTLVADATTYAVTVLTQPVNQLCTVTGGDNADGTGTVAGGNVSSITVNCVPTFTISGNVTGTAFGAFEFIVLQNNGGDDITITASAAPFTFATGLIDGAAYAVTVDDTNTALTCTITGGGVADDGSGNILTANVTNIDVNCI